LTEIADIGRDPVRGGYSRHLLEPAETELRAWFRHRAGELGLDVVEDATTTIWARWTPEPPAGGPAVATGSHLDSVPGGGPLDGPLGVAGGLAVLSRWRADGFQPARPVTLAVFPEEEGSRFGLPCLGSRLLAGALDPAAALELRDRAGVTLAAALAAAGRPPLPATLAPLSRDRLACLVELHVEQGRALADLGRPVAVARSILAHGRWHATVTGDGNHAGATPMSGRRDPVVVLARLVLAVQARARAVDGARGTVGRLTVTPGGTNVIASRADAWLDLRAPRDQDVTGLADALAADLQAAAAAEGCTADLTRESRSPEVVFDPDLADRLAELVPGAPRLDTGAGHDAGVLAAVLPTGMLFVRNPTGHSHTPAASADPADLRAGVDALDRVLRGLAG
jgi:N-carbamoyl-L-amino-acid hydrolase